MNNYQRTASWLAACGKAPGEDNLSTQIGCHFEETAELLRCIDLDDPHMRGLMDSVVGDLEWLADKIKSRAAKAYIPAPLREDALDALCDCEVTGNGIAYCAGFDKPAADAAVLASNDAKLVDGKPVLRPGGKIGKPPGWTAPDLSPYV